MKAPQSFHGVEPITEENVRRDLLLYDIRVVEAQPTWQPNATGAAPTKVKFSF